MTVVGGVVRLLGVDGVKMVKLGDPGKGPVRP